MNRFQPTRRDFVRSALAMGALGLLETPLVAACLQDPRRLSFLANRTAGAEGVWKLGEVEGRVPAALNGTLYRTAPGQSENHGVTLRHIFDGDAYVTGWSFRDGKAWMRGRFVATPERLQELERGAMLFSEFGTNPPGPDGATRTNDKNQPSVNLVHWDGRLLGLSEGGHPTAIDPATLAYQQRWDFHGTLPPDTSYTAHPKFDSERGVGYGWGISRRQGPTLVVYRMETNGKLTELHRVPLRGAFMVHDMMLTREHLVFLVPPLYFDRSSMQSRTATPADSLTYGAEMPLQLLVLGREPGSSVRRIELPGGVLYHHGNAFEADDVLTFDTFLSRDNALNELLSSFSAEELRGSMASAATRIEVDLAEGKEKSRTVLRERQEFPRFDERRAGTDLRFLYAAEASLSEDPLVFSHLARFDLQESRQDTVPAGEGRALGEPVFVAHPDRTEEQDGWVLQLGFDGPSDRSFLEIREAQSLELEARVWAETHVPLGFHGNFVADAHVSDSEA